MSFDQIQQLLIMQKQLSDTLTSMLKVYGISMTFEKIVLYPNDDPNAIDLVYRIKCENEYLCEMLKDEFKKRLRGTDDVGEQGED
ncbi:MAG: hypothetical protein QXR23_08875 [Ignisphaera sp.]